MRFSYTARNRNGQLQTGELTADTPASAVAMLSRQNLITIDLVKKREPQRAFHIRDFLDRNRHRRFAALFFRRLSVMIDAIPINEILRGCAENEKNRRYREMLLDIGQKTELGITLPNAMKPYENIFSPFAVRMIDLGQQSGSLADILPTLADYMEQDWQRAENMRSIMLYPLILAAVLTGAMILIVGFVLPSFTTLFTELGAELPLPTRWTLAAGEFCFRHGALFLPTLLVILAAINLLWQYEKVRRRVDLWRLKLPLFGKLECENIWVSVLGSLSILLKSGMRIDDALLLMQELAANAVVRDVLQNAHNEVMRGQPLAKAFAESQFFPPLAVSFVQAGESSGQVDFMLKKSAEYCRVEADNLAKRIEAAAQPTAILVLGGAVMWIVLSVMLPLWSAMGAL